ncbi:peptidoglycan bridge formation glycyltransferase FemA/FemB family protein [Candidatus Saccharibacteria bacterium]|nr:peptidoglycan bridge formation glycyltransferase FemA/FemB family protein [Candidatus Saccharibacteria bacterium]
MIAEYPANFLQSKAWAKMNELVGHKVASVKFGEHTNYLIVKSARRGRYLEIPGGPILNWNDKTEVEAAFVKIREIAKENKCVFVRLRPQLLNTPENLEILKSIGAVKAPMHLHAEHTVIIDLTKSEDELLADMRR